MILAFDTSGPHCALALLDPASRQVMGCRVEPMARGQAERLMPMVEDLMDEAGATYADITAIGVGTGPGNFTGIRIGVAAARGLGLGLERPVVGISNFEIIAAAVPETIWATVPAPRDSLYVLDMAENGQAEPGQISSVEAQALDGVQTALDAVPLERRIVHLAHLTAQRATSNPARPAPLYVRAADAAPSRDAPPVILDAG